MKYISFDVGIKNLSYCIIDIIDDGFDIIDWNVITLCDNKEKVNQINLINVGKTLKYIRPKIYYLTYQNGDI